MGGGWEQTKWEMVVKVEQMGFWDTVLAEEATWQAVVLIPKLVGD